MLLEELKFLIKDFESVLSQDTRFKKDMFFKNQVKIIYGSKKINNVFIPIMANTYTEKNTCPPCPKCEQHKCPEPVIPPCPKCEQHKCPEPVPCPKCEQHKCPEPVPCPKCEQIKCPEPVPCPKPDNYKIGSILNSNKITEFITHLSQTSSEEDDVDSIYEGSEGEEIKDLPIPQQIEIIKETDLKFKNYTDYEIFDLIIKYIRRTDKNLKNKKNLKIIENISKYIKMKDSESKNEKYNEILNLIRKYFQIY